VFTGLVQEKGRLQRRVAQGRGARLTLACGLGGLALGESVAVDGVCLTVAALEGGGFACDASSESLARTTLGRATLGAPVNLERALAVGERLGGHIVTGHVDGVGRVASRTPSDGSVAMRFAFPADLGRFVAAKGSVCVSGVSLTVNRVEGDAFDVMLIPHTLACTSLGELAVGSEVNLEVDILARYVARMLEVDRRTLGASDEALMAKLRAGGFA
jgi:riboflavin synthase